MSDNSKNKGNKKDNNTKGGKESFFSKHGGTMLKTTGVIAAVGIAYQCGKNGGIMESIQFGKDKASEFFNKQDS